MDLSVSGSAAPGSHSHMRMALPKKGRLCSKHPIQSSLLTGAKATCYLLRTDRDCPFCFHMSQVAHRAIYSAGRKMNYVKPRHLRSNKRKKYEWKDNYRFRVLWSFLVLVGSSQSSSCQDFSASSDPQLSLLVTAHICFPRSDIQFVCHCVYYFIFYILRVSTTDLS